LGRYVEESKTKEKLKRGMHYPIRSDPIKSAAGKQKRADSKPKLNLPDWEDTLRNQKQKGN
jgi:hypothetical protein